MAEGKGGKKLPPTQAPTGGLGAFGALLKGAGLSASDEAIAAAASPEPAAAQKKAPPSPFGPDKIVVRMERKGHGGKTCTAVEGLPAGIQESTAKALRGAMGTGARVEEGRVIVQGDLRDRVAEWLQKQGAKRVIVS